MPQALAAVFLKLTICSHILFSSIAQGVPTLDQKCHRNLFPVLFGGDQGESSIQVLVHFNDNVGSGRLAIGGYTKDSTLITDSGAQFPFMALYSTDRMLYEWGKYFVIDQSYIADTAVSQDGTVLISFLRPSNIIIVQSAFDGKSINFLQYSMNVAADSRQHNLLLLDPLHQNFAFLFLDIRESNQTGYGILKFDYLANANVEQRSTIQINLNPIDHSYGFLYSYLSDMILTYTQSIAFQGTQLTFFDNNWQIIPNWAVQIQSSPTQQIYGSEINLKTQKMRIVDQDPGYILLTFYHSYSFSIFLYRWSIDDFWNPFNYNMDFITFRTFEVEDVLDIYIQSFDIIYFSTLMIDTILLPPMSHYIFKFNRATQQIQIISRNSLIIYPTTKPLGSFYQYGASIEFRLAYSYNRVNLPSQPYILRQNYGIVASTEKSKSCESNYQQIDQIRQASSVLPSPANWTQLGTGIPEEDWIFWDDPQSLTKILVNMEERDIQNYESKALLADQCNSAPLTTYFELTPPSKKLLQYEFGLGYSKSWLPVYGTASKGCTGETPEIQWTLHNDYGQQGTQLMVSVDHHTGLITIRADNTAGPHEFVLVQIAVANLQRIYYRLILTGLAKDPPDLYQVVRIEDMVMSVDLDETKTLPPITSPYSDDNKQQSLQIKGPRDVSFINAAGLSWLEITFETVSNGEQMSISFKLSSDSSLAGTYSMKLKLSSIYGSREYPFTLTLKPSTIPPSVSFTALSNLGPPYFTEEFVTSLTLVSGESKSLKLPPIEDPDGDSYTVSVDKCLGFFCSYTASGGFVFKNLDTKATTTYTVKVTLKDLNPSPKQSVTSLLITLTAPESPSTNSGEDESGTQTNGAQPGNAQTGASNTSQQETGKNNVNLKKEKCKMGIKSVDRQGQIVLKIQQCSKSQEIAQQLTKKDLEVTIINKAKVNFELNADGDLLKLDLKLNGLSVSNSQELDLVRVKLLSDITFADPTTQSTLPSKLYAESLLPPLLSPSQQATLQKLQQAQQSVGLAMLPISFAVSFIMSFFIQFLFSLLNDLSPLMLLSLIPIYAPGLAQPIQSIVLSLIQLDLLQTDKWLPQLLFTQSELDTDSALNECFGMGGYQSRQSIVNAGSGVVYMGVIAGAFGVMGGARVCGWQKVHRGMRKWLGWNVVIRYVMQQYPALMMAASINTQGMKWESAAFKACAVFACAVLAGSVVVFVVFKRLIRVSTQDRVMRFEGGEREEVVSKCNTLTDGLNLNTTLGRHWNLIFLLRQFSMVFILVFLRDHPTFQLILIHLHQLSLQSAIIHSSPLHSPLENRVSLFNELMVSLYLYTLQSLLAHSSLDQSSESDTRPALGWLLLSLLAVTILVNIGKTGFLVFEQCRKRRSSNRRVRKYAVQQGDSTLAVEDVSQENARDLTQIGQNQQNGMNGDEMCESVYKGGYKVNKGEEVFREEAKGQEEGFVGELREMGQLRAKKLRWHRVDKKKKVGQE
ncbi:hypothetical protein FGO68_gene17579 [Halteria grandinella]|uniref:Cadherin domain-containing protein n=1 Tax=Halteria grandinella TaxID=5974 RepID=A0A8J8P3N1_HALGN|nr:hypothetical protein FGO68_gene17579 [Halteria grandinella]